jgi:hypothetical protein
MLGCFDLGLDRLTFPTSSHIVDPRLAYHSERYLIRTASLAAASLLSMASCATARTE